MSEQKNDYNDFNPVVEKNVPVFIETDGVTVQVGWASEVQENGGRAIEKFSAFKKVVLVNPIFGDGEGEIEAPIENHVDPEEDGLTEANHQETQTADGQLFAGVKESEESQSRRAAREQSQGSRPVDGGTDESLNAAPVSADPDGDTAVGQPSPAPKPYIKGDKPDPFTRTN